MVPVCDFLTIVIALDVDFFTMCIWIRRNFEWVFSGMRSQTATTPWGGCPNPRFVVTGPGMLSRSEFPDVTSDNQHHGRTTCNHRLVEVMVRSFPVVNRRWLNGARITRPTHNQVLRSPVDLVNGIQVIVL